MADVAPDELELLEDELEEDELEDDELELEDDVLELLELEEALPDELLVSVFDPPHAVITNNRPVINIFFIVSPAGFFLIGFMAERVCDELTAT